MSVRFLTPSCGLSHHISRPRVVVQLQRRASSGPGSWGVLPPGLRQRGPILLTREGTLGVQMAWLCCRRLRLPCTVLASRLAPNEHLPKEFFASPPPTSPHSANRVFPEAVPVKHTQSPTFPRHLHALISFGKIQRQKEISYRKWRENRKNESGGSFDRCAQRGCSAKEVALAEWRDGPARDERVYHLSLPYR